MENGRCPHCGERISRKLNRRQVVCEHCGSIMYLDDVTGKKGDSDAGSVLSRAGQGGRTESAAKPGYGNKTSYGTKPSYGSKPSYGTRTKTQGSTYAGQKKSYSYETEPKKRSFFVTLLWVLGWILCFPIPLTILILKSSKFRPVTKIIVVMLLWGLLLQARDEMIVMGPQSPLYPIVQRVEEVRDNIGLKVESILYKKDEEELLRGFYERFLAEGRYGNLAMMASDYHLRISALKGKDKVYVKVALGEEALLRDPEELEIAGNYVAIIMDRRRDYRVESVRLQLMEDA